MRRIGRRDSCARAVAPPSSPMSLSIRVNPTALGVCFPIDLWFGFHAHAFSTQSAALLYMEAVMIFSLLVNLWVWADGSGIGENRTRILAGRPGWHVCFSCSRCFAAMARLLFLFASCLFADLSLNQNYQLFLLLLLLIFSYLLFIFFLLIYFVFRFVIFENFFFFCLKWLLEDFLGCFRDKMLVILTKVFSTILMPPLFIHPIF